MQLEKRTTMDLLFIEFAYNFCVDLSLRAPKFKTLISV